MKLQILILSLLLITSIARRDDPKYWKHPFQDNLNSQQQGSGGLGQQKWFEEQIIDHFNYQSSSTWKQRYFVIKDQFKPSNGPVFIYICGEYTCPGVPITRQWVITLARQFQGLILVPQHRYYGKSMPFGNDSMKLENMVHLNSQQALSDIAYFIEKMKQTQAYGITDKTPFITIGGSYPGALSAWFRAKYPHLTIGSIASSAVVEAIQDMKDFDEQMYSSSMLSGDYCAKAINQSSHKVQQILASSDGASFKANFTDGDKLQDDEFLFFWVDSIVGEIQYGNRVNLCQNVKGKSEQQQFKYFVSLAQKNDVYQYGSVFLCNDKVGQHTDSRSWYYQSCTEFGYWQTFSDRHPLRSFNLTLDFYRKFCNDAFGNHMWPKVNRKNAEYGGVNIQATKLLMANGVQDPWRWASLQTSKNNIISRVANCTNCAHCVDLYTPSNSDSPQLKMIRNEQYLQINMWMEEHWRNVRSLNFNHEIQTKNLLRQE